MHSANVWDSSNYFGKLLTTEAEYQALPVVKATSMKDGKC